MNDDEIRAIRSGIERIRLQPSLNTHREHVRHVRQIANEPKRSPISHNCPDCGKPMRLRQAARSAKQSRRFSGCSAYPACRGTKPFFEPHD